MTRIVYLIILFAFVLTLSGKSQGKDEVISGIIAEANENSNLEALAHELIDVIGPRLVGSPQQKKAHEWAVNTFQEWDILARNEEWGTWRGWERGITHVDLIYPRIVSLNGMQLAWSPSTKKGGVEAEVINLAFISDSLSFQKWLSEVKGKIILISQPPITGRPISNWEKFATEKSLLKTKTEIQKSSREWREMILRTGYHDRSHIWALRGIRKALEDAGAVAIIESNWAGGFGANKISGSLNKKVPIMDLSLEDYGLLYRLVESGEKPIIRINVQSKELGKVPVFNTIAEIPGTEKPEEYVILSAHFDSWDGGTGATDNGTGVITMMEVARILKKHYPKPKRTIIVGLWGAEEQGLNGSKAYVEDNPDVVEGLQVLFNQDSGTGRVVKISGSGFRDSYAYLTRWLNEVPNDVKNHIETEFPGRPTGGGSDHGTFIAAGVPAFSLSSLGWGYRNYTWHTNLDTFDKIVFDDLRNNVILTAVLAYMASEDDAKTSRVKAELPMWPWGEQMIWPEFRSPNRDGGN